MSWKEQGLAGRREEDPGKARLARELPARATMPLTSTARRLNLSCLAWLLCRGSGELLLRVTPSRPGTHFLRSPSQSKLSRISRFWV